MPPTGQNVLLFRGKSRDPGCGGGGSMGILFSQWKWEILQGLDLPLFISILTRKMVPIIGRAGTFLEFVKLQSQSKLNLNQIQSVFCSPIFLYLQGQSELCGSYHLLQSCFLFSSVSMANLSCLVATIFSSLAFIFSSVYMAKPSCLIAVSFSSLAHLFFFCLYGQSEVFVSDHLLQS